MDPVQIALLLGIGLAAGFVAGLLGIGGGLIFGPVLLFYFGAAGIGGTVISKLTAGSSLFCTLVVGASSAFYRWRAGSLLPRVAWRVGLCAAVAVVLTTQLVTTQPWYDETVFQVVLGVLLVGVTARMVIGGSEANGLGGHAAPAGSARRAWPRLAGIGTGAGIISPAAGVGGGVVLVPAYHRLLRLPMERASGTSSGTVMLISLVGIASYAASGWGVPGRPATAVGYVDFARAALLAGPSILGARFGVRASGNVPDWVLRWTFAAFALVVAARLLYGALGA
jgi:uncharacterized membrane protein YfcA